MGDYSLDGLGRWIASAFDAYWSGIASLAALGIYILVKAVREPRAITPGKCLGLVFAVFTLASGTSAGAVLILTRPTALELLSKDSLPIVGVVTVIGIFGQAVPDIVRHFRDGPESK